MTCSTYLENLSVIQYMVKIQTWQALQKNLTVITSWHTTEVATKCSHVLLQGDFWARKSTIDKGKNMESRDPNVNVNEVCSTNISWWNDFHTFMGNLKVARSADSFMNKNKKKNDFQYI